MYDSRIRISNVIFVAVMLVIFLVAYFYGVILPRNIEERVNFSQEVQLLAVDLAVALANKDSDSLKNELFTIKLNGTTYPESISPDWNGKVVCLSVELEGYWKEGNLRGSFLKTFVDTYDGKVLSNQERKKRKDVKETEQK